jgi:bile acid:Na+ symporter, BASS family
MSASGLSACHREKAASSNDKLVSLQTLIPLVLKVSILLNVFAIGLLASPQDATYLFRRPGELGRAFLAMNLLMPLFAVSLVLMFHLNPAVEIALVALSISPIPPVLPKKMMKAGGTESYAIGLLVAVCLLAIIFVPLAMEVLRSVFKVPLQMTVGTVALLVLKTVLLPLGLGIAVHRFWPAPAERLAKPISRMGTAGLLLAIVPILFTAEPQILALIGSGTIAALAAFIAFGLAVGHWLGGPQAENRTALAYSTASRHPGIAIALAHANFPRQKLAVAAVLLYLVINTIVSVAYRLATKRRPSAVVNEKKAA